MDARPFMLLGASAVSAAADCIRNAMETWCSEWGLRDLPVEVDAVRAWEASAQQRKVQWLKRYSAEGKAAWLGWQPECVLFLQRQMFPSDQRHQVRLQGSTSLAAEVAEAAVQSLLERLVLAASFPADCTGVPDTRGPVPNAFSTASGALLARVRLGEHALACLMDHECIQALAGSRAPSPPVPARRGMPDKTLDGIRVTFPVEVGHAVVDVASLLTLSAGDVIRLNTPIDRALTVYGPGQTALFHAHLGMMDGKIAVEVIRHGERLMQDESRHIKTNQ